LPEDEVSAEREKEHYVGTINFFGKGDAKHGHADKTFTETFDVTGIVGRLERAGRWKADSLSVTLRSLTPIPPKGQEDALQKRTEESSRRLRFVTNGSTYS